MYLYWNILRPLQLYNNSIKQSTLYFKFIKSSSQWKYQWMIQFSSFLLWFDVNVPNMEVQSCFSLNINIYNLVQFCSGWKIQFANKIKFWSNENCFLQRSKAKVKLKFYIKKFETFKEVWSFIECLRNETLIHLIT